VAGGQVLQALDHLPAAGLARALYRRPKLHVMDEGAAHFQAATERQVNTTISAMGITRVIIVHWAETIFAADRLLMATGGKLIEFSKERSDCCKALSPKHELNGALPAAAIQQL